MINYVIMKRLLTIVFLIAFAMSGCKQKVNVVNAGNSEKERLNSIALISRSLSKGEINRDEAALYKTYAIFDREKLPAKYRSSVPQKDATIVIRQLKKEFDSLGEETKEKIRPYLFRKKGGR